MNKPAAIPLFMYRKRQREAVLSDPIQITTQVSSSVSPPEYGSLYSKGNADKKQTLQAYSTSNSSFSNQTKTGPNVQGSSTSRITTTITNMDKNSAAPHLNKYNVKQPNQTVNRATTNNFIRTSSYNGTAASSNFLCSGFQRIDTFNDSLKRSSFSNNSNSNFKCNTTMQAAASTSGITRQPSTNTTIRQNRFNEVKNENLGKQKNVPGIEKREKVYKEWNSSKRNEMTPTNLQTFKVNKNNANKKDKDSSMHIFTCSISSMKSWGASSISDITVMFEIYGLVDSATLKDGTGTGKEFMLRDDTSSIKCVFYEIDRELPRLIRGQVHRAIGLLRKDLLQVIHVRAADKEERQVCILASQVSQREMEDVMKHHNEQ